MQREESPEKSIIPSIGCLIGKKAYLSYETYEIRNGKNNPLALLSRVPRLAQSKMVNCAWNAFKSLRAIDDDEWFGILSLAGSQLSTALKRIAKNREDDDWDISLVARSSGLPEIRVIRALERIAEHLTGMRRILTAQSPDGKTTCYRDGYTAQGWAWMPRGKNIAVKIPGNFPTVNINWLLALACRRPVVLCASLRDPFTPQWIIEVLYRAGLPDGAVSLCFGNADHIWRLADQVLWPGDLPKELYINPGKVKKYHYGQSKAILLDDVKSADFWGRLARLAIQGCGRLCTNVSAVIVDGNARNVGLKLANAFNAYFVCSLSDHSAIIPAFPDERVGHEIAHRISSAISRGAVDLTAITSNQPLKIYQDGLLFLRPTVLLIDVEDPLFGTEFPFPFVTVAGVRRSSIVQAARKSLIVYLADYNKTLIDELLLESSIDKVFSGDEYDREYDPAEPHEGFLSDFLFQKKAVSPLYEASTAVQD